LPLFSLLPASFACDVFFFLHLFLHVIRSFSFTSRLNASEGHLTVSSMFICRIIPTGVGNLQKIKIIVAKQ
jgi:hypothetical protein